MAQPCGLGSALDHGSSSVNRVLEDAGLARSFSSPRKEVLLSTAERQGRLGTPPSLGPVITSRIRLKV